MTAREYIVHKLALSSAGRWRDKCLELTVQNVVLEGEVEQLRGELWSAVELAMAERTAMQREMTQLAALLEAAVKDKPNDDAT